MAPDIGIAGGSSGRCSKIIDPNGNVLDITYDSPQFGAVTYADQLGRQVTVQGGTGGATVTIKGYSGLADRVYAITTGQIGAADTSGNPINLRSDYWSWQRPFLNGDWDFSTGGHATATPHTDLFWDNQGNPAGSDSRMMINIDTQFAVTRVDLPDSRTFRFRYNPYGELAEVVYPGGGVSQLEYDAYASIICEANSLAALYNRGVSERRLLSDGVNVDAAWTYSSASFTQGAQTYPGTKVEVKSKPDNQLLMSESHFFLKLDAEYRSCNGEGSDGSGYEHFENAKEFRVERMTGSGATQIETRDWSQRAAVSWGAIPFVGEYGQQQPPNDERMTREDMILENNKLKRVEYGYDNFNNVTSIVERDFGASPSAGTIKRQTTRTYVTANNNHCYTKLNGPAGCAAAPSTDPNAIIHMRRLLKSETVKDGSGSIEAYGELEYDNYAPDTNHASIVVNSGMIFYNGTRFSLYSASIEPRGNVTQRKRLISGAIIGGSYTSSYLQYDQAGNAVKAITPNDLITSTTTISYADDFGDGSNPGTGVGGTEGPTFAMPTSVTNSLSQVVRTQYSYSRGVKLRA